ncbi:MAG: tryptophan-rich sensory protein [Clostridia bacterium]|nr:tryptophan-rich sensory protein [Clostridia bacterium]
MSNLKIYVKSILITVILGGLVGFIISGYIDYSSLQKPPLAPPSSLFPIVWTILYILMGISYGILKSNNLVDSKINLIYYSQLIVNLLWPIAFFVLKWRFFAFLWIILLVVLVINMIIQFYNKNQLSALLQIPYLLWLLFATYLNLGVYLLNR